MKAGNRTLGPAGERRPAELAGPTTWAAVMTRPFPKYTPTLLNMNPTFADRL
jgi:hypothetical protein